MTPLGAGLTYLAMAVTFGGAGLWWRRLPAQVHRSLPAAGMALFVVAYLALAAAPAGGAPMWRRSSSSDSAWASPSARCSRPRWGTYRPTAADASGVLTTTMQLSRLLRVAVFGGLFLASWDSDVDSSTAMAVVGDWLACAAAVGLVATLGLTGTAAVPRPSGVGREQRFTVPCRFLASPTRRSVLVVEFCRTGRLYSNV